MASTLAEPVDFASVAIVTDGYELLQTRLKRTGTEWSWGGRENKSRGVDVEWVGIRRIAEGEEEREKKPARLRGLFGCLTEERTTGQGTGEKKLLLVRKQSGLPIGRCGPLRPRSGTAISHSSVSDSNARLLAPARSARQEAFRLVARLVEMVSPT